MHAFRPNAWEAEAGGPVGEPVLKSKYQDRQDTNMAYPPKDEKATNGVTFKE